MSLICPVSRRHGLVVTFHPGNYPAHSGSFWPVPAPWNSDLPYLAQQGDNPP